MKLNQKFLLLFALCLSTILLLCSCYSERADAIDTQIKNLVKKGVTYSAEGELLALEEQILTLSDWEKNSMEYADDLAEFRVKFDAFIADKIAKLQEQIDNLPELDQIRVATRSDVDAAESAYKNASEYVRSQVTGVDKLKAAVAKQAQVLEDAWQPCTNCGGDGKTVCPLCNGRGSRQVYHTTPNGKTWKVSQDCKTTSTCSACSGKGGIYVE